MILWHNVFFLLYSKSRILIQSEYLMGFFPSIYQIFCYWYMSFFYYRHSRVLAKLSGTEKLKKN